MALVLCTGRDPTLTKTRQLILERAGHRVIAAAGESEIKAACQEHAFEVAVVGQSDSRRMKLETLALVREHCPSAKILELYSPFADTVLKDADAWLQVPADVPQELAEQVTQLASKACGQSN